MFKKAFPGLMVKIHKKLFSVFIGCVLTLALAVPAAATFYEVKGLIKWNDQPLSNVNAYLVSGSLDLIRENIDGEKIVLEVAQGNFYYSYRLLEQRVKETRILDDGREKKKKMAKTVNDFRKLIKLYMLRNVTVNNDGRIYLNVGPGRVYYLVVLKKNKFFKKNDGFMFWIEKLYFKPGNILEPKEIQFNETNVTMWQ